MSQDQQVVIVTGATGNLGQAVAQRFARENHQLVLLGRNQEKLDRLASKFENSLALSIDLTDLDNVTSSVSKIIDECGRIDILANVAGGFTMGPLLQDTDQKEWDFMFDLNTRSVFNMCRAVLPYMLEKQSGRIINVSARAATSGKAKMAPYSASKAAVVTLTESLAAENKHTGINVNCILPGTIDTPQNRADMPDANFDHWVPPAALADVIGFLASNEARCISGAAIPVYGES